MFWKTVLLAQWVSGVISGLDSFIPKERLARWNLCLRNGLRGSEDRTGRWTGCFIGPAWSTRWVRVGLLIFLLAFGIEGYVIMVGHGVGCTVATPFMDLVLGLTRLAMWSVLATVFLFLLVCRKGGLVACGVPIFLCTTRAQLWNLFR